MLDTLPDLSICSKAQAWAPTVSTLRQTRPDRHRLYSEWTKQYGPVFKHRLFFRHVRHSRLKSDLAARGQPHNLHLLCTASCSPQRACECMPVALVGVITALLPATLPSYCKSSFARVSCVCLIMP